MAAIVGFEWGARYNNVNEEETPHNVAMDDSGLYPDGIADVKWLPCEARRL